MTGFDSQSERRWSQLNTIETYVFFWNFHEPQQRRQVFLISFSGLVSFSFMRLIHFLSTNFKVSFCFCSKIFQEIMSWSDSLKKSAKEGAARK